MPSSFFKYQPTWPLPCCLSFGEDEAHCLCCFVCCSLQCVLWSYWPPRPCPGCQPAEPRITAKKEEAPPNLCLCLGPKYAQLSDSIGFESLWLVLGHILWTLLSFLKADLEHIQSKSGWGRPVCQCFQPQQRGRIDMDRGWTLITIANLSSSPSGPPLTFLSESLRSRPEWTNGSISVQYRPWNFSQLFLYWA